MKKDKLKDWLSEETKDQLKDIFPAKKPEQEGISKGEHTPGKLEQTSTGLMVGTRDFTIAQMIYNLKGGITIKEAKANAARIVTCWNLFNRLQAELYETICDLAGLEAQGRLNENGKKRLADCRKLYNETQQ